MAAFLKNILGGAASQSASPADSEFQDFAAAPAPAPAASSVLSDPSSAVFSAAKPTASTFLSFLTKPAFQTHGRPYTKWYNIHERVSIEDFYQELAILPILVVIILAYLIGVNANRSRAKKWAAANRSVLESEFAKVGHEKSSSDDADALLKESSKNVWTIYATGRQNIAFVDIKLTLYKRFNPLMWFVEIFMSFVTDLMPMPVERVESTAYLFDGKEKSLIQNESTSSVKDSTLDGFVWAIVHKDKMKQLRDDRYDVSLTATKDHAKLPVWLTIMAESAEITEALLTPELIKAVEDMGDDFEALIVSDQPIDAPKKLDDTVPRKRISLATKLTDKSASSALFSAYIRLADQIISHGKFRPEAMKKIKATREDEQKKLRKIADDEKKEELRLQSEKAKKEERDRKLSSLDADSQRKFLAKERDMSQKRAMKKRSMKA